jgi:hypothetical protein
MRRVQADDSDSVTWEHGKTAVVGSWFSRPVPFSFFLIPVTGWAMCLKYPAAIKGGAIKCSWLFRLGLLRILGAGVWLSGSGVHVAADCATGYCNGKASSKGRGIGAIAAMAASSKIGCRAKVSPKLEPFEPTLAAIVLGSLTAKDGALTLGVDNLAGSGSSASVPDAL